MNVKVHIITYLEPMHKNQKLIFYTSLSNKIGRTPHQLYIKKK
jgi:hypothetical protein